MYQRCLANADDRANTSNGGSPYFRGSPVCGRNNAPSFRYGDMRYKKTSKGVRGWIKALRTPNWGLWSSSSSSSLVKSKGALPSSWSWTKMRAEEESRAGDEPRDDPDELSELVERRLGGGIARGGGAFAQAMVVDDKAAGLCKATYLIVLE